MLRQIIDPPNTNHLYVLHLTSNKESVLAAFSDGVVRVYELDGASLSHSRDLIGSKEPITDQTVRRWSSDDSVFVSSSNGIISQWDVRIGNQIRSYAAGNSITSVSVHNNLIAGGDEEGNIHFWDERTTSVLKTFEEIHPSSLVKVRFHSAGYLISASDDGIVSVFDCNENLDEDESYKAGQNLDPVLDFGFYDNEMDKVWFQTGQNGLALWNWKNALIEEIEDGGSPFFVSSDLRPTLQVESIITCFPEPNSGSLVVVGGFTEGSITLFPFSEAEESFSKTLVQLAGGHQELVRCCIPWNVNFWLTGGEDGRLCLWTSIDETVNTPNRHQNQLCIKTLSQPIRKKPFTSFGKDHREVENTEKLHRRACRDLAALKRFMEDLDDEEVDEVWLEQRKNQIQGFRNNLVSYESKVNVARALPGVTAFSKVFQYPLAPGIQKKGVIPEPATSKSRVKVEVDIVANGGSTWVQIRNVKIADLDSLHWIGMPGHHKGLEQKLKDLVHVAASSEHWIRWKPPAVVIYCAEGFPEEVQQEIENLGGHCITGGLENLSLIPSPPSPPTTVNLDVTTICALVSEVSFTGPTNPSVIQWAERVPYWKLCVQQEAEDPLLPQLEPLLSRPNLIVAEEAVEQFEGLLKTCGGPHERERWTQLQSKLKVFPKATRQEWISQRVQNIEDLTEVQYAVFGLGDSEQAITVSCNARIIHRLHQNGIHLESFEHRAVWLTGF